jgi:hypothetical protein
MVQATLETLWNGARHLWAVLWPLLVAALGAGLAAQFWRVLRPRNFRYWSRRLWPVLSRLLGWAGGVVLLAAVIWGYGPLGRVVQSRLAAAENAVQGRGADADAAPTTQEAPRVTYLTERTYSRSLILPPELLRRLDAGGVNGGLDVLAPYLDEPGSDNVIRWADRVRRGSRGVVLTREVTLRAEEPVRMEESRLRVSLEFGSPLWEARRPSYRASFAAQYAFANPLDRPVTARFSFPLPQGSGTLSEFAVLVDGRELPASGALRGFWEGRLAAGQRVRVDVRYRHQGARGWRYVLGSSRESLRDFSLTAQTDGAPRFPRYSLLPTRTARSLGGTTLIWELKNVITAQDVALSFPARSGRETAAKLYAFTPAALLLAAVFAALWGRGRGLHLLPGAAALAVVGLTLGSVLGGMLLNYLPVFVAAPLGAVVGAALALRAAGRGWWPPVVLAGAAPLVVLVPGHAGVLLAGVGIVVFVALLRTGLAPGQAASDEATEVSSSL